MNATAAIIGLDVRSVLRDNVMLLNIGVSFVGMLALTVTGLFQANNPDWTNWFPFLVILALMTNPGGYGFQFALLLVDEREGNISSALAIAPVRPEYMLLVRTLLLTIWLIVWPLVTVYVMNATWQALDIPFIQLLAVASSLALLGPLTTLGVGAYAANKVEAIALFKGLSFMILAPAALQFIPAENVFRYALLLSPSGAGYMAFDNFLHGQAGLGYAFAVAGAIYNAVLLACAIRFYQSVIYKTNA